MNREQEPRITAIIEIKMGNWSLLFLLAVWPIIILLVVWLISKGHVRGPPPGG
ncbi:hypothetical protein ACFLTP_08985 [Chloroflexota bacterium]